MENKKLCLSVSELAEHLGIGITSAYKLVKSPGFYPAKNVCGRIIISVVELEQWLKEQVSKEER